jgi:oleate hydratase
LKLLDAEDNLDGNWSLWLGISPSFGDPYNFCTRVSESRLEAFTITVNGVETFNHFKNLAQIDSNSSGVILLRHSNWLLNLYIPHQPLIPHQPDGVKILWGFGSIPNCEGNFVRKSMLRCSGQEIMIETLQHLDLPLESILPNVTTIPRIMPRLTAPLLSRACRDRPKITSQSTANLAVIGQFVEISGRTCATMDYSVRGAKEAVSSVVSFRKELAKANKTLDA